MPRQQPITIHQNKCLPYNDNIQYSIKGASSTVVSETIKENFRIEILQMFRTLFFAPALPWFSFFYKCKMPYNEKNLRFNCSD